jgi:hypothetical protein
MSIRTTVTLDEDVLERVKHESAVRGSPFRDTLNDLLRLGLLHLRQRPGRRAIEIKPVHMGFRAGLNHDNVESLLQYGEGDQHR